MVSLTAAVAAAVAPQALSPPAAAGASVEASAAAAGTSRSNRRRFFGSVCAPLPQQQERWGHQRAKSTHQRAYAPPVPAQKWRPRSPRPPSLVHDGCLPGTCWHMLAGVPRAHVTLGLCGHQPRCIHRTSGGSHQWQSTHLGAHQHQFLLRVVPSATAGGGDGGGESVEVEELLGTNEQYRKEGEEEKGDDLEAAVAASRGAKGEAEAAATAVAAEAVEEESRSIATGGATSWWLEGWENVPWNGWELALGMVAWIFSFFAVGLVCTLVAYHLHWGALGVPSRPGGTSDDTNFLSELSRVDRQALFLLLTQSARTVAGVGVLCWIARPYQPLPPDLFKVGVEDPLSWRQGWLLWSGIGIVSAGVVVQLTALTSLFFSEGEVPVRDSTDALLQVLPLISGESPIATLSLLCVVGVLAPILEESVFRGFLLPSLSKWMPTPAAIVLSAAAFSAAHFTPSEFTKLAALGTVMGFAYVRTRNLLTPIVIHSLWNSGIIILLTLLQLQGFEIEKLL